MPPTPPAPFPLPPARAWRRPLGRTKTARCFARCAWKTRHRAVHRPDHFVAGLNILVVLAMTVTDRARDIAVLMSLGTYRNQVRNIFVLQGLT